MSTKIKPKIKKTSKKINKKSIPVKDLIKDIEIVDTEVPKQKDSVDKLISDMQKENIQTPANSPDDKEEDKPQDKPEDKPQDKPQDKLEEKQQEKPQDKPEEKQQDKPEEKPKVQEIINIINPFTKPLDNIEIKGGGTDISAQLQSINQPQQDGTPIELVKKLKELKEQYDKAPTNSPYLKKKRNKIKKEMDEIDNKISLIKDKPLLYMTKIEENEREKYIRLARVTGITSNELKNSTNAYDFQMQKDKIIAGAKLFYKDKASMIADYLIFGSKCVENYDKTFLLGYSDDILKERKEIIEALQEIFVELGLEVKENKLVKWLQNPYVKLGILFVQPLILRLIPKILTPKTIPIIQTSTKPVDNTPKTGADLGALPKIVVLEPDTTPKKPDN